MLISKKYIINQTSNIMPTYSKPLPQTSTKYCSNSVWSNRICPGTVAPAETPTPREMARRREPLRAILQFFEIFKSWAERAPSLQSHKISGKKSTSTSIEIDSIHLYTARDLPYSFSGIGTRLKFIAYLQDSAFKVESNRPQTWVKKVVNDWFAPNITKQLQT